MLGTTSSEGVQENIEQYMLQRKKKAKEDNEMQREKVRVAV